MTLAIVFGHGNKGNYEYANFCAKAGAYFKKTITGVVYAPCFYETPQDPTKPDGPKWKNTFASVHDATPGKTPNIRWNLSEILKHSTVVGESPKLGETGNTYVYSGAYPITYFTRSALDTCATFHTEFEKMGQYRKAQEGKETWLTNTGKPISDYNMLWKGSFGYNWSGFTKTKQDEMIKAGIIAKRVGGPKIFHGNMVLLMELTPSTANAGQAYWISKQYMGLSENGLFTITGSVSERGSEEHVFDNGVSTTPPAPPAPPTPPDPNLPKLSISQMRDTIILLDKVNKYNAINQPDVLIPGLYAEFIASVSS